MVTVEIPRTEWARALGEFAAVHEGWLMTLEVVGPDVGAQPVLHDLPLVGIWVDAGGDGDAIRIAAARTDVEHVTHVAPAAQRVYIERTEEGADAALGISSGGGTMTILRFRAVVLPETVDGIARPLSHDRTSQRPDRRPPG